MYVCMNQGGYSEYFVTVGASAVVSCLFCAVLECVLEVGGSERKNFKLRASFPRAFRHKNFSFLQQAELFQLCIRTQLLYDTFTLLPTSNLHTL